MTAYLWWAIAGFGLIIVELLTGTFYLLVIGLAALAGGLLGWAGLPFPVQAVVASVLTIAGILYVHHRRRAPTGMASGTTDTLDVGRSATLESWVDEAHRLARVSYRNTYWDAKVLGVEPVGAGALLTICAVDGNILQVTPHA